MKKNFLAIIVVSAFLLFGIIKIAKANTPLPCGLYFNDNLLMDIYIIPIAFIISLSIEIAIAYIFIKNKLKWWRAVIYANLVSYPFFLLYSFLIVSVACGLGKNFFSYYHMSDTVYDSLAFQILWAHSFYAVIPGEILVIILEAFIIRKVLKEQISNLYSFFVSLMINFVSWIAGGIIIYCVYRLYFAP